MKRGETGRFVVSTTGDESVRAFVPDPLPPSPSLEIAGPLQRKLEDAVLALGRLDGVSAHLPNRDLFLYSYIRREAVLSSQIEGTQSSLSDLLLFEQDATPGVPIDDVVEVVNYVAALEHGLARLRGGFPLSSRLFREIHGVLLRVGRGSEQSPGEFRRSQNWIGGTRPGNAQFVPPPHTEVMACMSDLERFLHEDEHFPVLLQAGLAHVQFETIHPFLDGNGRVGRLLFTFILCEAGILQEPLLYISLYLKRHRSEYYDLLDNVRRTGDWEVWLAFFLEGVRSTSEEAVSTARQLTNSFRQDRTRIHTHGRKAGSMFRVHDILKSRPVCSIRNMQKWTGLSYPTVSGSIRLLEDMGIVREITGRKRGRVYAHARYLDLLSAGTEI